MERCSNSVDTATCQVPMEADLLDVSPDSLELDRLRLITFKHCTDQEILVVSADLYFKMQDFV